jgi:hypothetical protein
MTDRQKNFLLDSLVWFVVFFIITFLISYVSCHLPLKQTLFISVAAGLVAGIIVGSIQSRFTKSYKTLRAINIKFEDVEYLKLDTPANYIKDEHLVSGKLFLTQKRLLFKSFKAEEYHWLLSNLQDFKFYPSLFNIGGEFIIVTNEQAKIVFEVDNIKLWKRLLLAPADADLLPYYPQS